MGILAIEPDEIALKTVEGWMWKGEIGREVRGEGEREGGGRREDGEEEMK